MSLAKKTDQELTRQHGGASGTNSPGAGRQHIAWEKLWGTSYSEYGRFSKVRAKSLATDNSSQVWKNHSYDTTYQEHGSAPRVETTSNSAMAIPHSGMTGNRSRSSAQSRSAAAAANSPRADAATLQPIYEHTTPHVVLTQLPGYKVLPPITQMYGAGTHGASQTGARLHGNPFPASGPAKTFMLNSCGRFWENIETVQG